MAQIDCKNWSTSWFIEYLELVLTLCQLFIDDPGKSHDRNLVYKQNKVGRYTRPWGAYEDNGSRNE